MPPKKGYNVYNKLCQLWRELHPECTGNKADATVKQLYYDPYKQGKIEDIDSVIGELENKLKDKKLKSERNKLSFYCFKKSAPTGGNISSASSATPSEGSPSEGSINKTAPSSSKTSFKSSSTPIEVSNAGPSSQPSGEISTTSESPDILKPPSPKSAENVPKSHPTPAQDKLKQEIQKLKDNIHNYKMIPHLGLIMRQQMNKDIDDLNVKEKKLLKMQKEAARAQKYYKKKSACIKRAAEVSPDDSEIQRYSQAKIGRPSTEDLQPGFLGSLKEIVQLHLGGTDERRRSETIRTVKTLNDLKSELENLGFNISRMGLYYHLLPKRANTIEGRRHHPAVPVRLIRAQNTKRLQHPDRDFCYQTQIMIKSVCKLFGPDCVTFLSVDDKARVPIGLTAAQKQSPLMMSLEYQVRLPDHDFVKAPQHKLIPSVNAVCKLNESGDVTYSGPTMISIRSGKHDSSSAFTHQQDLERLLDELPQYKLSPIFVVSVDGGPDENPRFPKTLSYGIKRFKDLNLDAYVTVTYAPGNSAFNQVERRMAPLSKELAGVILPHEHYGSHLDPSGRTIDEELERKNFKKAGTTLAEIWSSVVINGHDVTAKYIDPPAKTEPREEPDIDYFWAARHVQQSQYCLQIVRCEDRSCCTEWKTNWNLVFPDRFLPPPKMLSRTCMGPQIPPPPSELVTKGTWMTLSENLALQTLSVPGSEQYKKLPFDTFCPSLIKKKELSKRICKKCADYFPSVAALNRHSVVHRVVIQEEDQSSIEEPDDDGERIQDYYEIPHDVFKDGTPIYTDLAEVLAGPFMEDI